MPSAARDVAISWHLTLTEPLLPANIRAQVEHDFAALATRDPQWLSFFAAGVLGDLARTLPETDPWRNLSARHGAMVVGPHPPSDDGASSPSGAAFGTYLDALDVALQVWADPAVDPAIAALSDPLSPTAAFLVAAAAGDRQACREAVTLCLKDAVSTSDTVVSLAGRGSSAIGPVCEAIRWLAHRRRQYLMTTEDPLIGHAVFRWSSLADNDQSGTPAVAADLEAGLAEFALVGRPS